MHLVPDNHAIRSLLAGLAFWLVVLGVVVLILADAVRSIVLRGLRSAFTALRTWWKARRSSATPAAADDFKAFEKQLRP